MSDVFSGPIDLDNCAREPIHVPGFIQEFGVLLAIPAGGERISQFSCNTDWVFGMEPEKIAGQKLADVMGEANAAEIRRILGLGSWKEMNPVKMSVDRKGEPFAVNVILHRYDGLDFVELEPVSEGDAQTATRSYQLVQSSLTRIQKALSIPDLWESVVSEVQRITGYDRVMLYQFDRDDHGYVVAEKKQEDQEQFLGLHYPASDIPDQARRLYRLNGIRFIPDSRYKPVPLIPTVDEDHKRLTDLTHSVLRSVSPIHCEYLHNLGVAASMSVSVLRDGHLWGLIACHHRSPRYIPYELRAACELVGQVLSIRLAALEAMQDSAYKSATNVLQARLLAKLPRYEDVASALVASSPNLLEFMPATGAAVCYGDKLLSLGRVPDEGQIRTILDCTLERVTAPIFVTDRLQDRMTEARNLTDTASGVLCFTVSRTHNFHVLWFRTEQVQVMNWGGEPAKAVLVEGATQRLGPRRSFEVWKQEVKGKSKAWLEPEIEAAAELRATLMSLLPTQGKAR